MSFVVWQPVPMIGYMDDKVQATFTARIGDGRGSELDVEKIVDNGFRIHQTDMASSYKKQLTRKLLNAHSLLRQEVPASAWDATLEALKLGELADLGLQAAATPIGISRSDGEVLLKAAESMLYYRYILENGMVSQNTAGVFDLFQIGLRSLKEHQSPVEKFSTIAQFESFPNLRSLIDEIERPFTRISQFRQKYTARRFREWLSTSKSGTDVDLLREYVNACSQRRRLFESMPAKFLKVVSMIGVAHVAGVEAAAAAGSLLLTSIPATLVAEALRLSAEFGTGIVDSFLIDNLKVGWTPRAYVDGLRRLRRPGRQ